MRPQYVIRFALPLSLSPHAPSVWTMVRVTTRFATTQKCPKCAVSPRGQFSCCSRNGAWKGLCGDPGDGKPYTWSEGAQACLTQPSGALANHAESIVPTNNSNGARESVVQTNNSNGAREPSFVNANNDHKVSSAVLFFICVFYARVVAL